MREVMDACVIMHNMIIKSKHGVPMVDDQPYEHQGPLAQVDHEVPIEFGAFLAMHQAIRDKQIHRQSQDDLVKHLWARKGNAT
jgi:hypothetical protein